MHDARLSNRCHVGSTRSVGSVRLEVPVSGAAGPASDKNIVMYGAASTCDYVVLRVTPARGLAMKIG